MAEHIQEHTKDPVEYRRTEFGSGLDLIVDCLADLLTSGRSPDGAA